MAALRHVVAAHLSEQNNTPDLARGARRAVLRAAASDILVAHPAEGIAWLDLG